MEEIDLTSSNEKTEVKLTSKYKKKLNNISTTEQEDIIPCCLRNEKITIKFIPKETGLVTNPDHVLYGGLSEKAYRAFTVPRLSSNNQFVNVLTNDEKNYLEQIMGLEPNSLSIYNKVNNFWKGKTVKLYKYNNKLDLSDPDDYISYKILLANKDFIAPNLRTLEDFPKSTYQFVLVSDSEEQRENTSNLTSSMQAFMKFGEIKDDIETLKLILEIVDGRPISDNTKLDFIQGQLYKLLQSNPKLFLQIAEDKLLPIKVLINKCLKKGIITRRGDYYYFKDNTPICENGEDPILSVAAKYLNAPKHQEAKLMLEAQLNQLEK